MLTIFESYDVVIAELRKQREAVNCAINVIESMRPDLAVCVVSVRPDVHKMLAPRNWLAAN